MYKKQNRDKQKDIRVVSLEDLVPRDHLLRKIDRAINFDFIYEEVKDLYSATEWGKPGIDPVSLFKIVLIQHLYGIRSMRQTIKEIEVNMAYRWFIGYDLFEIRKNCLQSSADSFSLCIISDSNALLPSV